MQSEEKRVRLVVLYPLPLPRCLLLRHGFQCIEGFYLSLAGLRER